MSADLEVVIGLAFLFVVLSLVASGANELVAATFRLRAGTLKKGIAHLLGDPSQADDLYQHPLIQSLYRGRKGPSYLPSEKFATALLDSKVPPAVGTPAGDVAAGKTAVEAVTTAIGHLPEGRTRAVLDTLWREAGYDIVMLHQGVETWFDDGMARVSGWYRRQAQLMLLVFGLILAVGLNVNAITVTQRLWTESLLREALIQQAQRAAPPPATDRQAVQAALNNVASGLAALPGLTLPIGWGRNMRPNNWYVAIAGWLLTAIVVSLGAPFWFELLNRLVPLRVTGERPPATPSPEGSPGTPGAPPPTGG